ALRAEALNAIAFAAIGRAAESTDHIWKTILAAQHHDVACFCAPDLKEKSIGRLREARQQAERLTSAAAETLLPRIASGESGKEQIVVFNTVPHAVAAPVSVDVPGAN